MAVESCCCACRLAVAAFFACEPMADITPTKLSRSAFALQLVEAGTLALAALSKAARAAVDASPLSCSLIMPRLKLSSAASLISVICATKTGSTAVLSAVRSSSALALYRAITSASPAGVPAANLSAASVNRASAFAPRLGTISDAPTDLRSIATSAAASASVDA